MELWDAYDESLHKIRREPLIRGEAVPDGVFHLVCDILVLHADGSYLIMQRDWNKHFGGMWEATAGGSALQGEEPADCAKRELFEETGIAAADIQLLGTIVHQVYHSIYCEFCCTTEIDKAAITLQKGETIAYKWVSKEELLSMPRDSLASTRILQYLDGK